MFCTACGARNSDDAKFCNQCGRQMPAAVPAGPAYGTAAPVPSVLVQQVGPAPGIPPVVGGMPPGRVPTLNLEAEKIELPTRGPSPRTMAIIGATIAVLGIAVGSLIAWRALRHPPPQPEVPQTGVTLVELPHVLVAVDASVGTSDPSRARTGETRSGSTGARRGRQSPGGGEQPGAGRESGGEGRGGPTRSRAGAGEATRTPAGQGAAPSPTGTAAEGGSTGRDDTDGSAAGTGSTAGGAGDEPGGVQPRGPRVGGYTEGESTDATGRMDPSVFSFVYRHHRSQIASCHSNVSRMQPVAGTMRVRVRLGLDGRVLRTRVLSNTTGNETLAQCVQEQISHWRYPQPEGGEVEFEYNFGFGS